MSKISPGTILLAFLAVLCGLLGVFIALRPEPPRPQQAAPQAITVPVASSELTPGRRLTLGDIAILKLTPEQMKTRGIEGGFMGNAQQIIGRVLKAPLAPGKPFQPDALYPEGMGPGIVNQLTPGARAITISVAGPDALLGFATAGSWVDVIFRSGPEDGLPRMSAEGWTRLNTRQPLQNGGNLEVTKTLIERVRVLAVDSNTLNAAPDKAIRENADDLVPVTLEVSPEQAERLRAVSGRGELSLALRSDSDSTVRDTTEPITLEDVLETQDAVRQMEVYQGTQFSRTTFERNGRDWSATRSRQDEDKPVSQTASRPAAERP